MKNRLQNLGPPYFVFTIPPEADGARHAYWDPAKYVLYKFTGLVENDTIRFCKTFRNGEDSGWCECGRYFLIWR